MVSGIQIVAFVVGIYYIIKSYKLLRDKKEDVKQFLLWTIIGLSFIAVAIDPNIVLIFSNLLGMSYRGNMIFSISIIVAYLVILHYSTKISELNSNISKLNEELAVLKYIIEEKLTGSEK
ncbi:hypothetical protein DRP07_10660 [Archaeoglobales archaeon]|nr:MAG: hypothetical protein DRP07_10660 [Archaeoglobales archaeon]